MRWTFLVGDGSRRVTVNAKDRETANTRAQAELVRREYHRKTKTQGPAALQLITTPPTKKRKQQR